LKRSLLMPGLAEETSVGPATASSRANRVVFDRSRGILLDTSEPVIPPGSRWKYGIP